METLDISSPVDNDLISGKITPAEWMIKKRKEIEEDIKKRLGLL